MGFFRVDRSTGELDSGEEVIYTFDLASGVKVISHQFGCPYRNEPPERCWPDTAAGPNYTKTDFKYVRELYRYTNDGKREVLIPGPEDEWRSKWAQWNMMPPFTYDEVRRPRFAIARLHGSTPALKDWLDKVEPKYANDPDYYPEDWEWRRLWIYEHYKRCCKCKTPLVSPLLRGVHGHTHHKEHSGKDRTHALDNLSSLRRMPR